MNSGWKRGLAHVRRFRLLALLLVGIIANTAGAEPGELYFTILHTNDEHSALQPLPYVDYHPEQEDPTRGGFARLGKVVGDIRAAKEATGEQVIVASAGDFMAGSPYMWLALEGEAPEISLMQQIGYDVITIGNHEFDYGPEVLAHYFRAAGYPDAHARTALVSSNLLIPEAHPLADCIYNTHVLTLDNGLRLGFFGLLGANAARLITNMAPVQVADPVGAATAAVRQLREKGVDVVIGVTHAGFDEDEVVASEVSGIDVMITGHYHMMVMDPPMRVGNTILAQSAPYVQQVGVLELAFDPAAGTLRIRNDDTGRPFQIHIDDTVGEDPAVAAMLADYTDKLNQYVNRLTEGAVEHIGDAVAHSDFVLAATPLQESTLGNFVTDAMRFAAEKRTGERVDFAIQANGVLRTDVSPGTMPYSKDQIDFYSLVSAIGLGMGYDNRPGYPLTSFYLTGNEIYRMMELTLLLSTYADVFFLQMSGGRVTYDPARRVLFRIPFTIWPVPTLRAVQSVERYTGEGPQTASDDDYHRVARRDRTLYHVVSDYYVLAFFPLVNDILPVYNVIPKDRHGNPLAIQDAIIRGEAGELKFWQAVVDYALSQPPGKAAMPQIPEYYAAAGARIMPIKAYWLALWLLPVFLLLGAALYLARRTIKRRRTAPPPAQAGEW